MNQKSTNLKGKVSVFTASALILFFLGVGTIGHINNGKVKKNLEGYVVRRFDEVKIDYLRMRKLKGIAESSVNKYLSRGDVQSAYEVLDLLISGNDWQKYINLAEIEYSGPSIPTSNDLTPIDLIMVLKAYFKDHYEKISDFRY